MDVLNRSEADLYSDLAVFSKWSESPRSTRGIKQLCRQVRNRDFGKAIKRLCAGCDVVDGVKYLGAVVPQSTRVTHTDSDSFKYDEALLMLECLLIDLFRSDSTLTVLAHITVWRFLSGIC